MYPSSGLFLKHFNILNFTFDSLSDIQHGSMFERVEKIILESTERIMASGLDHQAVLRSTPTYNSISKQVGCHLQTPKITASFDEKKDSFRNISTELSPQQMLQVGSAVLKSEIILKIRIFHPTKHTKTEVIVII